MAVPGYVLKHRRTTFERAEKFISSTFFTDVNLYGKLYPLRTDIKGIKHRALPGLITRHSAVTFEEAIKGIYEETRVGASFGPTWATHWFRLDIEIPREWGLGKQVVLVWDSGSEAMIWRDGKPLQGLSPDNKRTEFVLTKSLDENAFSHTLYIEMECSDVFGAGKGGLINPPDPNKYYTLRRADIVVKDPEIYQLLLDFEVLLDLIKHLPEESNRSYQLLYGVNEMVTTCQSQSNYSRARDIAHTLLSETNSQSQHTLCAVGHCHIDTAWLWPYEETKRKCARSWSSTVRLMKDFPEFIFACSQAQQFDWVKVNYPSLYADIKDYVRQQRFIPVGGTWVEMDGNIPSGEAFIRQFLYGQRFFEQEFGKRCTEFWLPDTFGYSAQLPQIMKHAGIARFVTQKLSWNLVNKFPHHTFWWQGLDGSRVLTHFPPGDSYGMDGKVEEVMRSLNNFKDKGRSNHSMYLFGYGDGGQGPTTDMLERLTRLKNVDGIPKVTMCSPETFFSTVETHEAENLCSWTGELYLELHNGTYTTHSRLKQQNRRAEILLRQFELLSTLSHVVGEGGGRKTDYPAGKIEQLWKIVLLNQFHDVLPGTSIQEVCEEAGRLYEDVLREGSVLLADSANQLIDTLTPQGGCTEHGTARIINTCSWQRSEVICWPEVTLADRLIEMAGVTTQAGRDGKTLVFVSDIPSVGHCELRPAVKLPVPVTVQKQGDDLICIRNGHIEAAVDKTGRVVRLCMVNDVSRNVVSVGSHANQFVIFDDVPLFWDAWDVMDYHLETRTAVVDIIEEATIVESGPLRATIKTSLRISDKSTICQYMSLDTGAKYLKFYTEVDWHESHKFLKVEFPLRITSPQVTYEIQFGHVQRPNHFNTSWDWARFEVCGHKWADLSEYDWGVAVLNDSHYGWSCIDSVLRLSLLRSSKSPDPTADMGKHKFTYGLMPHSGTFQSAGVIQAAYELNEPLVCCGQCADHSSTAASYFSIDNSAVILETVKKAENCNSVILRLYEVYGGTTTVRVKTSFKVTSAHLCSGLEDSLDGAIEIEDGNCLVLHFSPFQIMSVKLTLGTTTPN
ncbi:hypothetical protein NP493_317g02034 [Ridgeia piscesae]|uniref:alpha-mannosidase n=1 Tax=Ridgeia piscesae TaxID=27915 RepID=A0AAD9L5L7_RIDPI|nr:hypothetical protein NP493_317g02034 [Ridgeia piscesae]